MNEIPDATCLFPCLKAAWGFLSPHVEYCEETVLALWNCIAFNAQSLFNRLLLLPPSTTNCSELSFTLFTMDLLLMHSLISLERFKFFCRLFWPLWHVSHLNKKKVTILNNKRIMHDFVFQLIIGHVVFT